MEEQRREILPGRYYRHFKGNLYRVLGIAVHSETGEKLVVYQAEYGERQWYVRPYGMFAERLPRNRYPDAKQEYRFALVPEADPEKGA